MTASTVGIGSTVIVKAIGVPTHPLAVGVTVIVAVSAVVPVFVPVNERISPEPDAPSPMFVLSFVQSYVVPTTVPVKFTSAVPVLAHNT